jgi:DNA helicase IV
MSMLRGADARNSLDDDAVTAEPDVDALAGPFAHAVVDEAQELTDAEWLMLLRRCPSRSLTVVGDRTQAREPFTESWEDRLARIGLRDVRTARLRINYRTPSEVMAVAEPVIRAAVPDANVPISIRDSGVPVQYGSADERDVVLDTWAAASADGIACVVGDAGYAGTDRIRSLSPEATKGLEFDLVVLVDPERWRPVDRYVAMTRATQRLVVLSSA